MIYRIFLIYHVKFYQHEFEQACSNVWLMQYVFPHTVFFFNLMALLLFLLESNLQPNVLNLKKMFLLTFRFNFVALASFWLNWCLKRLRKQVSRCLKERLEVFTRRFWVKNSKYLNRWVLTALNLAKEAE